MGYATVMRVPRIRDYAEALKKYNNTKPIKGRDPVIVPLGERRDADTYSIRKNVWTEAVELVLYKTPVIKFTIDDEVKISFGAWSSASTCQFITRILNVQTYRLKGQVVMHFQDTSKAMIADHEELTLVRREDGVWLPKEKQTLYDYRVSRKEANNVRKSVSQFRDYINGVVKLKAEERVTNEGSRWEHRFSVVKTTYGELIEMFGQQKDDSNRVRPHTQGWENLDNKPKWFRPETRVEMWANYREKTQNFFELVKNDQCDNTRHQNYWIAFHILMVQGQSLWPRENLDTQLTLGVEHFDKVLEKILFKMFSDKVFTKVALPEGKVPTARYDEYVKTEED
jgi:hypothetical protein